jgi:hypothetical protein
MAKYQFIGYIAVLWSDWAMNAANSPNMCLHIAIRNRNPFLGFFTNDCVGQTVLNTYPWYHIAFVYSYELSRQIIYLNGIIDGEKYSADPF